MIYIANDDARYAQWQAENRDGFVANMYEWWAVLHRVGCPRLRHSTTWYGKACTHRLVELNHRPFSEHIIDPCDVCQPYDSADVHLQAKQFVRAEQERRKRHN